VATVRIGDVSVRAWYADDVATMLDHDTTVVTNTSDVTAIVLVGPPASGKTTVRKLLSDYDVVGTDVSSSRTVAGAHTDWQEQLRDCFSEASDSPPAICCIEGVVQDTQVEWIRSNTDSAVVIRIDTASRAERLDRYVEQETSIRNTNTVVAGDELLATVRSGVVRREELEKPYPQHDVRIVNDDSTRTTALSTRCAHLVDALAGA